MGRPRVDTCLKRFQLIPLPVEIKPFGFENSVTDPIFLMVSAKKRVLPKFLDTHTSTK